MFAAYLTTDKVNEHLALQMAPEYGVTVCPWPLREAPPNGEFAALIYDWDHLPAPLQRSRSTRWRILPVAVRGIWPSAMNAIERGRL